MFAQELAQDVLPDTIINCLSDGFLNVHRLAVIADHSNKPGILPQCLTVIDDPAITTLIDIYYPDNQFQLRILFSLYEHFGQPVLAHLFAVIEHNKPRSRDREPSAPVYVHLSRHLLQQFRYIEQIPQRQVRV